MKISRDCRNCKHYEGDKYLPPGYETYFDRPKCSTNPEHLKSWGTNVAAAFNCENFDPKEKPDPSTVPPSIDSDLTRGNYWPFLD